MPHSSSGFGEVRVDRVYLVERETARESTDGKLSFEGQESAPPTTVAMVTWLHGQVAGMQEGKLVPVTFRDKAERNGYYGISSASSELADYQGEVATATWNMELTRLGSPAEVDLQSRLTGAVRQNDFSLTGTRWHAPAINHYAYHTGTTAPTSTLNRTSSDGTVKVYLGIPASIHPKWGCAVADFYGGRVRITDTLEVSTENEVEGVNRQVSASGWGLSNGLINVTPTVTAGVLNVQYYDGSAWQTNNWSFQRNFSNLPLWSTATILRNDFEECIIRLTSSTAVSGRTSLDLKLKRGSRFVEGYMQTSTSTSLKAQPTNITASTSGSGYQVATAGTHRPACGSARTFSVDNTNGGIFKSSTTAFDFWVGVVINAASPAGGDAVTDLRDQYIGSMPELTYCVRR